MSRLDEIKERDRRLYGFTANGFDDRLIEDVDYLIARVEKLEEALKFYAIFHDRSFKQIAYMNDAGKRAREVLGEESE